MDEWLGAREIAVREFNSLRGRLCTVIESAGLPQKQERALVLLIKNLSYQNQAVVSELIERLEDEISNRTSDPGPNPKVSFRYTENKLEN